MVVPAGASRRPATAETLANGDHYLRMDGRAVAAFITEIFPQLLASGLQAGGVKLAGAVGLSAATRGAASAALRYSSRPSL